jgi:D-3-phosphoglycerate dehydrogenase
MARVLITTVPFGVIDRAPLNALDRAGIDYVINPIGRRLKEDELAEMIGSFDILIAGTEPITEKVLLRADRLKLISRVGIGLDNVDLLFARARNIAVSYTPDAPAPAVAELSIGLIFALMRSIHLSNSDIHQGVWKRYFGRRMCDTTVGLIGIGRIGTRVLEYLHQLEFRQILINDVQYDSNKGDTARIKRVEKETIYEEANVISLHLPLTPQTRNLIGRTELLKMKLDAMIINTSRGGIINEAALAEVLSEGHLSGAAIDVFEQEPYVGPLASIERCLLTAHLGSMSSDCRAKMEMEAIAEALRFVSGQPLQGAVPLSEYQARSGDV